MKATALSLLLLFLFPSSAFAAQVYGTLRESGRPVTANVTVEVMCGKSTYSAVTDNYGSYRLFARETGKCTLRVTGNGKTGQTSIDSYTDPAHYDFDLVPQGSQYQLVRK
jgi:hypothetical protein